MLLDPLLIHAVAAELNGLVAGARVEKVHQPDPDLVVMRLHPAPGERHLVVCLDRGLGHVGLTSRAFRNPPSPPAFCGLLRKYLSNARIREVTQPGLERIFEVVLTAGWEGHPACYRLIVELFGRVPNAYLVAETGRILGACRDYQGLDRLAGGTYVRPEPFGRPIVTEAGERELAPALDAALSAGSWKPLQASFDGVGAGLGELLLREAREQGHDAAWKLLATVQAAIARGSHALLSSTRSGGRPPWMVPWMAAAPPIRDGRVEVSALDAVDRLVGGRLQQDRVAGLVRELETVLSRERARHEERLTRATDDLARAADADRLERWGHLLQSQPEDPPARDVTFRVRDLFDPEEPEIEIPIRPGLGRMRNAQALFNRARRLRRTVPVAERARRESQEGLATLERLGDEARRAASGTVPDSLDALRELKQRLDAAGLVRTARAGQRGRREQRTAVREYRSSDGYTLLVGKSARDNDRLSTRLARRGDLWLHAHQTAGAHVVVKLGGADCPRQTLEEAAQLAAFHSPHRYSSKASIAFTRAENVRKPPGSPAGLVTLRQYQTLMIRCDPSIATRLLAGGSIDPEAGSAAGAPSDT